MTISIKIPAGRSAFYQLLAAALILVMNSASSKLEAPRSKFGDAESASIVLTNTVGLTWTFPRVKHGWALGKLSLHGKPVETPVLTGILMLRNKNTGEERWMLASRAKPVDERAAQFSGKGQVDGASFSFEIDIALEKDLAAAQIRPRWSVDKNLDGWDVCLTFQDVSKHDLRCTLYPFAGNSTAVDRERLTYVGVPAALLFREDLSLVALFGMDPASDYLNPTTWTGATGFHFKDRAVAPQYRVGDGKFSVGVDYNFPLQLFLSDAGNSVNAITALVHSWIRVNNYRVQPLFVRTPNEALAVYLEGRRRTSMWNPGMGYQIQDMWKAIYIPEQPVSAWFDYLVYEHTGDKFWRERAFQQMDFVLKAQHVDPTDLHVGVIETNYELDNKVFNSKDHSENFGYRVDMNAYAARYMLKLWERVKEKEGLDRKDWYQAAVRIADWVTRQQNPDGGLPQVVNYKTGTKTVSVVSGRALVAMPEIYRITGGEKSARLSEGMERFLRKNVEGRYWFTGAHPDLWATDFEADSVWCAVEYWLNKYGRTNDRECLARAEADALFGFLMFCPKQLSWVRNPTQTCHAEQEHYLQYSNYCYNNRKIECLYRLGKLTGQSLFTQLSERIMQSGFWAQETHGPYAGAQYERMSDPWKGVSNDFDSKGTLYMTELSLDSNLQLLEMEKAKPRK
jgi:hypothetical protein